MVWHAGCGWCAATLQDVRRTSSPPRAQAPAGPPAPYWCVGSPSPLLVRRIPQLPTGASDPPAPYWCVGSPSPLLVRRIPQPPTGALDPPASYWCVRSPSGPCWHASLVQQMGAQASSSFSRRLHYSWSHSGVAALQLATKTPSLRERVASRAEQFRAGLRRIGVLAAGHSHVVPWVVGPSDRALRLAAELCGRGVFVQAIRPPSVPPDAARLRFTLTALHTSEDVERALGAIVEAVRCAPP